MKPSSFFASGQVFEALYSLYAASVRMNGGIPKKSCEEALEEYKEERKLEAERFAKWKENALRDSNPEWVDFPMDPFIVWVDYVCGNGYFQTEAVDALQSVFEYGFLCGKKYQKEGKNIE